jgi:phospholipid transport system substrate-binding protein
MAKSSLGANWSKATPQEQSEFVELFTELLAQSYLKKIRENIEVSEITFQEPVARDATVVVKSTVSSKGDEFPIDYRMRLTEGRWRVYDVVVENVGLISNYRNEFTTIVRKEQMSGLLLRLREKLAKTKQG